ncbi:MAG: MFS transporter [Lachnospiraceae bacterium]|nr:MFS transporter [Lachnospiraceae bacterium]
MKTKLGKKFYVALALFGLTGQVAWVVENMYFNVFIYKMFHASAADISMMVGASAVAATLTAWLMGVLSDRIGKRKLLICAGYILWGISILAFAFIRVDLLSGIAGSAIAAMSLGITLVIIMDCVMTFFGSTANDAAFNAWMTDFGDATDRGRIEGINAMMPLIAILVVFGGFMGFDLDRSSSWVTIYFIIGFVMMAVGISGLFLIHDSKDIQPVRYGSYVQHVVYSLRPSVIREHVLLYVTLLTFAAFNISIQIFMPYLILYYEKTLGMTNYVLIFAPAILAAALITAFYGRAYDQIGFKHAVIPVLLSLGIGYIILYCNTTTIPVFIGTLFMLTGYLTGMAVFGAMIKERIPEESAGLFQGIRILCQVLIPGVIGPAISAFLLRNAETIVNSDGTTSFLPNKVIFLAALVAEICVLPFLEWILMLLRQGHFEKYTEAGEALKEKLFKDGRIVPEEAGKVWAVYPRPQLQRDSFLSLNGLWNLKGKKIVVPFSPEAPLSGFLEGRHFKHVPMLMKYEKTVVLPDDFRKGKRVLLHFGAVDQTCEVLVNHISVGKHAGGYLPFTCDITDALREHGDHGFCHVTVKAVDRLSHDYPYGKQRKFRGGMWYTPTSGIWQSVWMEAVPEAYTEAVEITPDLTGFHFSAICRKADACKVTVYEPVLLYNQEIGDVYGKGNPIKTVQLSHYKEIDQESQQSHVDETPLYKMREDIKIRFGRHQIESDNLHQFTQRIDIKDPKLWSVESPYLYPVKVEAGEDVVYTYAALRTMTSRQVDGKWRFCLNEEPIFLHGLLDQGYYSDGHYLPAVPEEYERDILKMQDLGFNMLRKHIKVEPELFYYYCDKHGMLVMQDMVNNGMYSFILQTVMPNLGQKKKSDRFSFTTPRRKRIFEEHMLDTVESLYNHPSIIAYTIFNEGWGQFDADAMYDVLKKADPTRLIDSASGWFAQKKRDMDSEHVYYHIEKLSGKGKPLLLSECGGFAMAVEDHYYSKYNNYGYGGFANGEALTDAIVDLYEQMVIPAFPNSMAGVVYTQLSDVEDEINGLMTYDRKVVKVDRDKMQALAKRLQERL